MTLGEFDRYIWQRILSAPESLYITPQVREIAWLELMVLDSEEEQP